MDGRSGKPSKFRAQVQFSSKPGLADMDVIILRGSRGRVLSARVRVPAPDRSRNFSNVIPSFEARPSLILYLSSR